MQKENVSVKEDLVLAKRQLTKSKSQTESFEVLEAISDTTLHKVNSESSDSNNEASDIQDNNCDLNQKVDELSKVLNVEKNIRLETETARHLLERDVLEKQDTIISLRKQLEDLKAINLQIYNKLQDCETTTKKKEDMIVNLENKATAFANTISQLETR